MKDGKISATTNAKTVNRLVFDTSVSAARPFYNPLKPTRSGDVMIIGGNLVGDHNSAVESIYNALIAKRTIILWTANNLDMIRSALKESEKNKRKFGLNSKLYLRAQSMQEIEGMSRPQIQALLSDIMENIVNGDDFPETQKKYNVERNISKKSHIIMSKDN